MQNYLKIGAAIILLPLSLWASIWYANWFTGAGLNASLSALVSGNPKVAVSLEIDRNRSETVIPKFKDIVAKHSLGSVRWVEELSEANVLLVAFTSWENAVILEDVPGLEETSRAARKLTEADGRAIYALSQGGKVILVAVIYVSPRLDDATIRCIADDFAGILYESFPADRNPIPACLDR